MGTCSYVLLGTERGMAETFGSTCHGAGRAMSRNKSRKALDYQGVLASLANKGISIRVASPKLVMEEVRDLVDCCVAADLSLVVAGAGILQGRDAGRRDVPPGRHLQKVHQAAANRCRERVMCATTPKLTIQAFLILTSHALADAPVTGDPDAWLAAAAAAAAAPEGTEFECCEAAAATGGQGPFRGLNLRSAVALASGWSSRRCRGRVTGVLRRSRSRSMSRCARRASRRAAYSGSAAARTEKQTPLNNNCSHNGTVMHRDAHCILYSISRAPRISRMRAMDWRTCAQACWDELTHATLHGTFSSREAPRIG